MARLGEQSSGKSDEFGKKSFGDKDQEYLVQMSREAVEEHGNAPILYLEIDWEGSKVNFYGEMRVKRFKNPKGVEIRGSYKITQGDMEHQNGIPYKVMKLVVSIYVEQFKELGIEPKPGDYFYAGERYYQIYDRTIQDVGPGQLMMNRGRIRSDYFAFEVDDETIQRSPTDENPGPEFNINSQSGNIIE